MFLHRFIDNDLIVEKLLYRWEIKTEETDTDQAKEKHHLQDLKQEPHINHGDDLKKCGFKMGQRKNFCVGSATLLQKVWKR